jgi:hypothetical protein
MCRTFLGPLTRQHIAAKRRWPAEVQAALDRFKDEFGALASREKERIADAVIARDITSGGDINGAVRRVVGENTDEFRAVFAEGARDGGEAGRRMASRRFGLDIADFDQLPERTISEFDDFVDDANPEIIDNLADRSADRISGWFEEGLTRDDVADRIRDELDDELGEAAVETHARTIVQGASERGNHSAIQDSSAIGERWFATGGERTRESHTDADGQIAPVDGTFLLTDPEEGESRLDHPGDPTGPLHEIVRCRCTTIPVFSDELTDSERAQLRAGRRLNV